MCVVEGACINNNAINEHVIHIIIINTRYNVMGEQLATWRKQIDKWKEEYNNVLFNSKKV